MNTDQQHEAADLLWESWLHGRKLQELPAPIRPQNRQEGYAIQALLEQHSAAPLFDHTTGGQP